MKLSELTEVLIRSLVKDPDSVSVRQFDDEEYFITIEVLVKESDMGAVIGRKGITAQSIRTIVQAAAYINGEKKVRINIDSI